VTVCIFLVSERFSLLQPHAQRLQKVLTKQQKEHLIKTSAHVREHQHLLSKAVNQREHLGTSS